jgi:DnaJ-class molecular chaperone
MFKDYYKILEIEIGASQKDIKVAYKKVSLKWHPDKNPNVDTTQQMQDINEAYIILNDVEARNKYNAEYLKYKESKEKSTFVVEDDILNIWMKNARSQAIRIVADIIDEFKGSTKNAGFTIIQGVLYVLPGVLVYLLFRGCR